MQAIGTLAAVPFAAAALIYAVIAVGDQQEINRDQMKLNEDGRERLDRRYASRVAWWLELSDYRAPEIWPLDGIFWIQNASTMPISSISFYVGIESESIAGAQLVLVVPNVPPCTVVAYGLPEVPDVLRNNARRGDDAPMYFTDTVGHWVITSSGLERYLVGTNGHSLELETINMREHRDRRTTAASCGESA